MHWRVKSKCRGSNPCLLFPEEMLCLLRPEACGVTDGLPVQLLILPPGVYISAGTVRHIHQPLRDIVFLPETNAALRIRCSQRNDSELEAVPQSKQPYLGKQEAKEGV